MIYAKKVHSGKRTDLYEGREKFGSKKKTGVVFIIDKATGKKIRIKNPGGENEKR